MTPFVVVDQNGAELYSGQGELAPDFDVVISTNKGGSRHHVDPTTPQVRIILPIVGEMSEYSPPNEDEIQFTVENAESARERTEEEEELNRAGGTIKPNPGGYPPQERDKVGDTETVTVNTNPWIDANPADDSPPANPKDTPYAAAKEDEATDEEGNLIHESEEEKPLDLQ